MMIAVCQHLSTRVVSSLVVLFDGGVGANYQPRHNSEIAAQNTSYRVYPSSGLSSPCHLFVCSKFDQTFCFLLFYEPAIAWNVRKFDPRYPC